MMKFPVFLLGVAIAGNSLASIVVSDLGTGSQPATVGGQTMTPFGTDNSSSVGFATSSAPSPLGGNVLLSPAQLHLRVSSGWNTWSNGYTGDVYGQYSNTGPLTMTLPSATKAFYLYAEPDNFGVFSMSVAGTDGGQPTILNISIQGNAGADCVGVYDTSGTITSITVSADAAANGFAVGEFGIAVPVPGTSALVAIGGLATLNNLRRRRA